MPEAVQECTLGSQWGTETAFARGCAATLADVISPWEWTSERHCAVLSHCPLLPVGNEPSYHKITAGEVRRHFQCAKYSLIEFGESVDEAGCKKGLIKSFKSLGTRPNRA